MWYTLGMEVSVREAARQLGLSPRRMRALALAGRVPARRIDERQWVVDIDAARLAAYDRHPPGRPLSPRSCWALLAVAEGREPAGDLSGSERARARERMGALPDAPAGWLASRASIHRFASHRGILDHLFDDERLVLAGGSAAQHHGADLIALERVEAYVREPDLAPLVAQYALRPAHAGAENVLVRIPSPEWPFAPGSRFVAAAVVGVDLVDAADERSVWAGRALLRRVVAAAGER